MAPEAVPVTTLPLSSAQLAKRSSQSGCGFLPLGELTGEFPVRYQTLSLDLGLGTLVGNLLLLWLS